MRGMRGMRGILLPYLPDLPDLPDLPLLSSPLRPLRLCGSFPLSPLESNSAQKIPAGKDCSTTGCRPSTIVISLPDPASAGRQ